MPTSPEFSASVAPAHTRLDPATPGTVYVVGDVHGCIAELRTLWDRLAPGQRVRRSVLVRVLRGPAAGLFRTHGSRGTARHRVGGRPRHRLCPRWETHRLRLRDRGGRECLRGTDVQAPLRRQGTAPVSDRSDRFGESDHGGPVPGRPAHPVDHRQTLPHERADTFKWMYGFVHYIPETGIGDII